MRKKIEWVWEKLDETTSRAKVIGGWIIHHIMITQKGNTSESMVFISDRDHEWMVLLPKLDAELDKIAM